MKSMCQGPAGSPTSIRRAIPRRQNTSLSPVRRAIRLLINYPALALELDDASQLKTVDQHGIPFLVELMEFIRQRPKTTTANILEHWRDTKFEKHLKELASDEEMITEQEMFKLKFSEIITKILEDHHQAERLRRLQAAKDTNELRSLYPRDSTGKPGKSDLA